MSCVQGRMDNKILLHQYRTEGGSLCLICQESIAVFKDYNLSRHFSSKHSNYGVNLSPAEKANKYKSNFTS